MTPLMKTGAQRFITEEDIYALPRGDTSKELGDSLQSHLSAHEKTTSRVLWIALFKSYGGPFAIAALVRALSSSAACQVR